MNKFKRVLLLTFVIGGMVFAILKYTPQPSICRDINNQSTTAQKQIETEIYNRADIDIKKHLLADSISKGNSMIEKVNDDIEYILLTVDGEYTIKHDSTPEQNAWTEWALDSTLQIKLKYQATYSIPVDKLKMYMDNATVKVEYDTQDIQVKSIEIKQYNVSEMRNFLGKRYNNYETIALIEIAQTRIRDMLQGNEGMIRKAQKNLEAHLKFLGRQFGIHSIHFNNSYIEHIASYEYIDNGNVAYGHPNKNMTKEVKYIAVHSTCNSNLDALSHEKWLNNDPKSNAVHYYIDDAKIVNTLDNNMIAWGTGNDYNLCSVQLEICEFTDANRQQKAIDNAIELINTLKQEFPNAKVVMHKALSDYDKNCPNIIYGVNAFITETEFMNKLN